MFWTVAEIMYNCFISDVVETHACTEYFYVVESFFPDFAGSDSSFDKIWKFCMKFGHMLLRKIVKFAATKCQI